MKNIYRILIAALAALIATSCLGDLDTQPIDESINTSEKAYADESSYLMGLAYINAYWCFVSQTAPDNSDITAPDAGQGELLRQFVNLQEMTADALKCTWGGDPYVADLCYNTWTTSNTALNIVYTRCVKAIALANEFLLQTEDSRLDARGGISADGWDHRLGGVPAGRKDRGRIPGGGSLGDVRSGAEERYVFFHRNFFDDKGNVPQITNLPYYTGKTTSAVDPRWGPSNGFNVVKDYTASAGTSLRIFFQENGFVYAEYSCSKGLVRMWLPADKVSCSDAVISK